MSELMAAGKVRQESLLKDAERCGMLQATAGPELFERILLHLSDGLISAGQRTLSEMPAQPASQS